MKELPDEENETLKKFYRAALKRDGYPPDHWAWAPLGMCAEIEWLEDEVDPRAHIQRLRDEVGKRLIGDVLPEE